jgi:hypothetical protein
MRSDAFVRAGYYVFETKNPTVRKLFPRGDVVLCVTRGGCSCDLCPTQERFDEARERRKYEKKGWSKPKIERALRGRRRETTQLGVEEFRHLIVELVQSAGEARLLVQAIRGGVETEIVAPHARRVVPLDEYVAAGGLVDREFVLDLRAT